MDVELGGFLSQNSTYDYAEDYEFKEENESGTSEAVLIPLFLSLVIFLGLLGHGLLLTVLVLKRRHWSSSDTLILHLGVADVLLLFTLPIWVAQAAQSSGWSFGVILCKISGAVLNVNLYCGVFTLVCISLNQRHTVFPNSTDTSGFVKKPVPICLIVWIPCLLFTVPDWIYLTHEQRNEEGKLHCIHDFSKTGFILQILAVLLGFFVPAVILITFCCMLLHMQFKSVKKFRVVAVIVTLVFTFLLCWIPYNITLITDTVQKMYKTSSDDPSGKNAKESSLRIPLMYTTVLACVHACLRPLLYLGLSTSFRKWTFALLRCETHNFEGSFWELCVNKGAELAVQSQEVVSLKPEPVSVQCRDLLSQC